MFNFDLNEFILHYQSLYLNIETKIRNFVSKNLLKLNLWSFCFTKTKLQNACGSLQLRRNFWVSDVVGGHNIYKQQQQQQQPRSVVALGFRTSGTRNIAHYRRKTSFQTSNLSFSSKPSPFQTQSQPRRQISRLILQAASPQCSSLLPSILDTLVVPFW